MSHFDATGEPNKPQRAIIFKDCAASGATLGYYGTIVGVLNQSIARNPLRPDLWVYRVFVPYFGRELDVVARELFIFPGVDLPNESAEQFCEVRFETTFLDDNDEIHGSYRLPSFEWDYFVFRKCDQPHPSYQLHMPIEIDSKKPLKLAYDVPQSESLDREYVLRAIAEIIGRTVLPSV